MLGLSFRVHVGKSQESEARRINKELANIRAKFGTR